MPILIGIHRALSRCAIYLSKLIYNQGSVDQT